MAQAMVLSSVFDCRQSVWLKCFVFSAQSAQMAEPESSSSGGESGADGGEEEVPHKGRARPASVVSSATGLVISHDHRKPRTCLLCNSTSSDDSPLEVTEEAAVDMALPWRSYDKVKQGDGDTVRVPSGKLCLICFNVYRALGTSVWPLSQVIVFVLVVVWAYQSLFSPNLLPKVKLIETFPCDLALHSSRPPQRIQKGGEVL